MSAVRTSSEEIRATLLASAKKLFLEKGISTVEMKAVAQEAGMSRSTLYRYMFDKSQLAFMVSTEVLAELFDKCLSATIVPDMSGYEKLELFVRHTVQILCGNISLVNFISEFDSLYKGEYPDIPEAREYSESMRRTMHRAAQFIFEGLSDKSIQSIKDPIFFISLLINTIFGLAERLLPRAKHYVKEHGVQAEALITGSADILLQSIRGNETRGSLSADQ